MSDKPMTIRAVYTVRDSCCVGMRRATRGKRVIVVPPNGERKEPILAIPGHGEEFYQPIQFCPWCGKPTPGVEVVG